MKFGKKIKYFRNRECLSQRDLAEKSGICYSYISLIESGKKKNVSINVLTRIQHALNVTPTEFWGK